MELFSLTLRYTGFKMLQFTRGWAIMAHPWDPAKMKLQGHMNGQIRGTLGYRGHLYPFQDGISNPKYPFFDSSNIFLAQLALKVNCVLVMPTL